MCGCTGSRGRGRRTERQCWFSWFRRVDDFDDLSCRCRSGCAGSVRQDQGRLGQRGDGDAPRPPPLSWSGDGWRAARIVIRREESIHARHGLDEPFR